jgi:nucleoside-diphosphate-sugar epimerase
MHILQTGVNGDLGREQFIYLVSRGHTVIATDIIPLLPEVRARVEGKPGWTFQQLDCRDMAAIEGILDTEKLDGVIHYGAISHPMGENFRKVHNSNVVGSYNILEACASRGINRVVQASSVNAPGLGFAPEGHITHDKLPIDETCAMRPVSRGDDTANK